MIKRADWIIDLGPEGGEQGGRIIAEGTPEEVALIPESYTGRYLKDLLSKKLLPAEESQDKGSKILNEVCAPS